MKNESNNKMGKNTSERDIDVLAAAYRAWVAGSTLRQRRQRNKRFTYGDQWGDTVSDGHGRVTTEAALMAQNGCQTMTNNLMRQLVKTVVGRYRSQYIDQQHHDAARAAVGRRNELDELDSRALEEFLISGCCVQRVEPEHAPGQEPHIRVDNVAVPQFLVNAINDPRGWDCELVGQLHDLSLAQLLRRVAGGQARRAAWVKRLYSDHCESRIAAMSAQLGGDMHSGTAFWNARAGRLRAIEVWTLESREVAVCHHHKQARLTVEPVSALRRYRDDESVSAHWDVAMLWHCRWFSPMGDVLAEYDSPWQHGSHPFVMKLYPLTDGEVHAMMEDVIDTQKHVNRLVSLVDHIMRCSAKGVLLFPETALPDGYTWEDVRRIWSSTNGLLPYDPRLSDARPEQLAVNNTDIGAYSMIELQLKLLEEISGVSGALQGKAATGNSATLYQAQSENANIALHDVYETFEAFRRQRDRKCQQVGVEDT